jgi:hypothetical protein
MKRTYQKGLSKEIIRIIRTHGAMKTAKLYGYLPLYNAKKLKAYLDKQEGL